MRFKIVGANAETGDDVDVLLEAPSQPDVEKIAHDKGILVSLITPLPAGPPPQPAHPPAHPEHAAPAHPPAARQKNEDLSAISLVDDDPPAAGDPAAPHAERAHGLITVSANSPSETGRTGSGQIDQGKHVEAPMEYHVILNQSLFLLESAVNRHLRDGWEPSGGVTVGVANNAMQFFQAMIRKHKTAAAAPAAHAPHPEPPKPDAPH